MFDSLYASIFAQYSSMPKYSVRYHKIIPTYWVTYIHLLQDPRALRVTSESRFHADFMSNKKIVLSHVNLQEDTIIDGFVDMIHESTGIKMTLKLFSGPTNVPLVSFPIYGYYHAWNKYVTPSTITSRAAATTKLNMLLAEEIKNIFV